MLLFKANKNKKRWISGIFLAVFAVALFIVSAKEAQAAAWYEDLVNYAFYQIFQGVSWLFQITGSLFDYVIKPEMFVLIIKSKAVYNGWMVVRDFFNLAFILVLLFSAFSTIFQVEKFHVKKILLKLVIIALLVNFSYPIALFIIDASNVVMYYLLNTAFPSDSISTGYAKFSHIADTIVPQTKSGNLNYGAPQLFSKLLVGIIFMFVLMATMMVMALTFLVRIVILMVLVIFAPAAFVAGILPSTNNYFDDWWKNLFKYSFLGPIMAFMILIGLKLLMEIESSDSVFGKIKTMTNSQVSATGEPTFLAAAVFFFIPIVVMWTGLIVSQKSGAIGAEVAMNRMKAVARGAGRMALGGAARVTGARYIMRNIQAYRQERTARRAVIDRESSRHGRNLGRRANEAQDRAIGRIPIIGRRAQRRARNMRRDRLRTDVNTNANNINQGGDPLTGTRTGGAHGITMNINNAFNATGVINPNITEDQANDARAYTLRNGTQRRAAFDAELRNRTAAGETATTLTGELGNILSAASTPAHIQDAINNIMYSHVDPIRYPLNEADMNLVLGYMHHRSEEVANTYINSNP